jgi:hypothetical protein
MVRFLPPGPNHEHLKNEAKALHKAHRRRDPEVCAVLRHVHRFRDASDEEILSANVPLAEAQFALAQEYGFGSWQGLRQAVLGPKPVADYVPEAQGDAMILPNPLPGVGPGNRLAAACSMALSYVGVPADYKTVAGDLGTAFILQADALHKPFNANIKALDIGWWPLGPWGAALRLDFLSKVYGVPMRRLPTVVDEYKADPALHYRRYYEMEVIGSLRAGRPVVAVEEDSGRLTRRAHVPTTSLDAAVDGRIGAVVGQVRFRHADLDVSQDGAKGVQDAGLVCIPPESLLDAGDMTYVSDLDVGRRDDAWLCAPSPGEENTAGQEQSHRSSAPLDRRQGRLRQGRSQAGVAGEVVSRHVVCAAIALFDHGRLRLDADSRHTACRGRTARRSRRSSRRCGRRQTDAPEGTRGPTSRFPGPSRAPIP